jgi:serine/threonine protein kinase
LERIWDRKPPLPPTISLPVSRGAFSIVKLATHKRTKEKRAVKIIDKAKVAKDKKVTYHSPPFYPIHTPIFAYWKVDPCLQEMLEREVDILKRIQHPNIISVVEIYESSSHLYLVMEL